MAKQKPRKKGVVRLIRAIIIVLVLAIAGLIGVNYFLPMLTSDSITTYDQYTVETGNIETRMSFSATLAVKKSETFTASEMTKVKELYVTSGDSVSEGDPLVLLTNGELFTASFDGVVNEIRVNVGDWVRTFFSVVQVSDLVNLEVTMSVDEYDVKSLSVGESCIVRIISLDEDFDTTIAHINRVSSSSGTLAYYTVSCDLTVPEEVLPGMRATVIIPDQAVTNVNILPLAAITFDEDERAYILIKGSSNSYEKQYIETGLSDGVNVEIVSGLSAGDVVYTVSGTESATVAFSLEDLYIALFGKKTVINAANEQRMGGGTPSGFTGDGTDTSGGMPSGFTGDGTDMAGGMPTDGTGFTLPDSGTMPDAAGTAEATQTDAAAETTGENTQSTSTQNAQNVQSVQNLVDLQNAQVEQPTDTNTEP